MKNLLLLILMLTALKGFTQDFSFNLWFSDATGHKDSLVIGFDKLGTDTIDSSLGEINILHTPIHPEFDVRISNLWRYHDWDIEKDSFQTKRQIIENKCGRWFKPITIDVFCKNWPVTIEWDSTLFKESCVEGSLLTSFEPGGWFDVGGGFITQLGLSSKIKMDKTGKYSTRYYYLNSSKDTIRVFWIGFGDARLPRLSVKDNISSDDFTFYPNPSKGIVYLTGNLEQVENIAIYSSTGRKIESYGRTRIDLSAFQPGVYFARIAKKGGGIVTRKMVIIR
jgi:hypothetical protein